MKCAIQFFISLALVGVVVCGFQVKPALANPPCRVTSTSPCVFNLENSQYVDIAIGVNQNLLAVYTNNSFSDRVSVTLTVGGDIQDTVDLSANESVFQYKSIGNYNGVRFRASSAIDKPNATVVVVQANSQQP